MARECGDCTVCCTYLRIGAPLDKAGLTPCAHILAPSSDGYTGGGCGMYGAAAGQPSVCQSYRCKWLDGHGEEIDRPDRSGMLIDNVLRITNAIQAKPIRKGAQDTVAGVAATRRISQDTGTPALVCGFPETHMVRVVGRGCA